MWESTVAGRELTFELVGLNNQNFIMRDRETGSWWQQVTGRAIRGPLAGERLTYVPSEISTFGLWKAERPDARVLAFDDAYAEAYFNSGPPHTREEEDMLPFHIEADPEDELERGETIVGLRIDGTPKAYPMTLLLEQRTVIDRIGKRKLLIVVADDDETVRAFDRQVAGRELELFREPGERLTLVDAQTGTTWDFTGTAIEGELAGERLERIPLITEYWFDWKHFNPESRLYRAGVR